MNETANLVFAQLRPASVSRDRPMARKISSDDRIVLWQGASLWVFDIPSQRGPLTNQMHSHHAFQLTLATGGIANIRTDETLFEGPVVLIAPDHPHSIEPSNSVSSVRMFAIPPVARVSWKA